MNPILAKFISDAQATGRGLRDNTVPNLVGGGVDMANLALSPFGLGSQMPIGGSAWIRKQLEAAGITPPSQGDPLEVFGGIIGSSLAPSAMNAAGRAAFAAEQNAAAPRAVADGPLGKQVGAINPKPRKPKAVGDMFDPIDDPDVAMRMAMRGDHIKRTPDGTLVGAPVNVNTPAQVSKMRKSADSKAIGGDWNADWYDRARAAIGDLSSDPAKQKLFARGTSAYSPQASPLDEVNYFTRQYNDNLLGSGNLVPRVRDVRDNVQAGIASGDGNKIKLGRKTSPYSDAKDPTIPDSQLYKTANDIWHGRVFNYRNSDGTQFSRGFTPQEHGFLTGENLRMSNRLTKAGVPVGSMPEGTQWTPRRAQAATWGNERFPKYLRQVQKKNKTLGADPTPGEIDAARRLASTGIDDAVERNTAYMTGEYVPGAGLGHLDNVVGMPEDFRQSFSDARRAAMSDSAGRSSLLSDAGMYTRPAVRARGEFTNPSGQVETNPMYADRPLVALSPAAPGTPRGMRVEPSSARAMDALSNFEGLVTGQHATPWHKITPASTTMQAAAKTGARAHGNDEALEALRHNLERRYAWNFPRSEPNTLGVINTGDGMTVTDFTGSLDGKQVQALLREAIKRTNDAGPNRMLVTPGRKDGGYMEPFAGAPPGSGVATQRALGLFDEFPNVERNIDAAGNWRRGVGKLNELDEQTAAATGGPLRPDLMLLRKLISERGLAGLREWIAKNGPAGLPAALLGLSSTDEREAAH